MKMHKQYEYKKTVTSNSKWDFTH